jgi:hypothetical protein
LKRIEELERENEELKRRSNLNLNDLNPYNLEVDG